MTRTKIKNKQQSMKLQGSLKKKQTMIKKYALAIY
jgi:hypothetical protein